MRRRFSKLITALSFVALIATIVVWALSYRMSIGHFWTTNAASNETVDAFVGIGASAGVVRGTTLTTRQPVSTNPVERERLAIDRRVLEQQHFHDDFERAMKEHEEGPRQFEADRHQRQRNASTLQTGHFAIPLWAFALAFSILPMLSLRTALVRRSRRAHGLCVHCAYDLRESPDRCPECGQSALGSRNSAQPKPLGT